VTEHGSAHATLSPSAAERWLSCPASVRLSASLGREDDGGNVYAEEGTRAHNLAEIEAAYAFGLTTKKEYNTFKAAWLETAMKHGDDVEEMEVHVSTYVSLLQDLMSDIPNGTIRLEQRVQTGVPNCWGTGDAILANTEHIHVVDFKYGRGVSVKADGNPQLRLYGVGALDTYDGVLGDFKTVGMTICQPRTNDISHSVMSADAIRTWRDTHVIPIAEETQRDDAHFGPSEVACRWCPAAGICLPRLKYVTEQDFSDPDQMTPDELAEAVQMLSEIRDWCNAIEAEALHQVYSEGNPLPGLKVVLSGGKRSISDKEAAIKALVAAGFKREQVARDDVQTLTVLEKLVGKQRLPEVLGDLLKKGEGKPALVPEDDPRPAIDPESDAAKDFQDTN
jgi:hypothetical protein